MKTPLHGVGSYTTSRRPSVNEMISNANCLHQRIRLRLLDETIHVKALYNIPRMEIGKIHLTLQREVTEQRLREDPTNEKGLFVVLFVQQKLHRARFRA